MRQNSRSGRCYWDCGRQNRSADMAEDPQEQEAVDALRKLVEDEKNLYVGKPADEVILREFLFCSDYNIDKAFEKLKVWYRLKAENSEFYAFKRDPNLHDVIMKEGVHMILPDRDQRGRRVYLFKLCNLLYGAHEHYEWFQVDDLWLTLALQEEETQKSGLALIVDFEYFPWRFLRYFTPHTMRASSNKAEAIPIKHLQYHVINGGMVINSVVSLVYPFLSQATKESVFIHKNYQSLHAHIAPSCLPPEYGGTAAPLDHVALARSYVDPHTDRLNEVLSYGYSEKPKA